MKYNKLLLVLLFLINGCSSYTTDQTEIVNIIKQNNFSNTGFALIYNDDLYKKKIVSKKLENRDLLIFQKNLKNVFSHYL